MSCKWFAAAGLLLILTSPAGAVGVPVEFLVDDANSALAMDVEVDVGLGTVSDDDSTSISGTIEAVIDLGDGMSLPSTAELSFTGGRFYGDDDMNLNFFIFLLLNVDAQIQDVSGLFQTPAPPGPLTLVNEATGQYEFDLADHELLIDQGMVDISGTALFNPVDESFNLADDPVAGSPEPGQFLGTVTLTETASDETSRTFHAELVMPLETEGTTPINEEETIFITVSTTGSMLASADFTIPIVMSLPGDYNDDGVVGAADYTIWRNAMGTSTTLPGDTTPGTVDQGDYIVWRDNYGAVAGGGAGSLAAVPEPGGALLLVCGMIAGTLLGRRNNCR